MDTVSYLTINGETREIADYNMRQDINTIQNDLNGVKTSTVYNTTHATVDARFESDETRIKALRDEVDAAHSSTVNKTGTQTAATYSNLDARFEADETKIKNAADEIAAAHRTSSDTLDARFDNIESRATAVEDEISAAHSSTQISGGQYASLDARLDAIDSRITTVTTTPASDAHAQEILDARRQRSTGTTANSLLTRLDNDYDQLSGDISNLLISAQTPSIPTEFEITTGEWNGFVPVTSTSPYYAGLFYSRHISFDLNVNTNQADFWVGVFHTAADTPERLYCSNLVKDDSANLRYVNISPGTAATIVGTVENKKVVSSGLHHIEVYADKEGQVNIFSDNELVQSYIADITDHDFIQGIGFLNLGIVSGNILNLRIYMTIQDYLDRHYPGFKAKYTWTKQGTDLDFINEPGFYEINANFINTPNNHIGLLWVSQFNRNYCLQLFFEYSSGFGTYYRIIHKQGTIYQQWKPISALENTGWEITDTILQEKGWTSYKDFPSGRVYQISVTDKLALGFPINRAGTFFTIDSMAHNSTLYNYECFFYITNDYNWKPQIYIGWGHGANVDGWRCITESHSGLFGQNPLSEALFNNNKIAFVGDSIVAGLGGTDYDISSTGGGAYIMERGGERYENVKGYCWVNELIKYISGVYGKTNIKNRGVGGITTTQVSDNWDTLCDGAKTIILSVGTNDYNNISNIDKLQEIYEKCKINNQTLMIMTNTPNNTANANKYNSVKGRITYNCHLLDIPVYDMYSEFEQYLDFKGLTLNDVIKSDGIHPNDTGYEIMFKIAKKLFQI